MLKYLSRMALLIGLAIAPVARAQFAVIDAGAIAQLIAQAKILATQLTTAQDALAQAQSEYAAMTGNRGMERLLSGVQRNYLPTDWASLQSAMHGSGSYAALAAGVAATIGANSVLSAQQLAALPPAAQAQIDVARRLTALQQNIVQQALATTSARFGSLQQLINALPTAADQKAALDLQARIGAENAMLQNERTKLQLLDEAIAAQQSASRQQIVELALAGHGQFASRFRPVP